MHDEEEKLKEKQALYGGGGRARGRQQRGRHAREDQTGNEGVFAMAALLPVVKQESREVKEMLETSILVPGDLE